MCFFVQLAVLSLAVLAVSGTYWNVPYVPALYELPRTDHPRINYLPPPPPPPPQCYGKCSALVACPADYDQLSNQPQSTCQLYGGASGVCCPPPTRKGCGVRLFEKTKIVSICPFKPVELNYASGHGLCLLGERDNLIIRLVTLNLVITKVSGAAYKHLQFFKSSPAAMKIGRDALTNIQMGHSLVQNFKLSCEQATFGLGGCSLKDTTISGTCPEPISCGADKIMYRTEDGSCNNLENPSWGQATTRFQRMLPPQYGDCLRSPRNASADGSELPSARLVSSQTVINRDNNNMDFTLSVMQWGQFIDHDITHTPLERINGKKGYDCCLDDPSLVVPECFPITIPDDDPFYRNRTCMNFVRSMLAPPQGCTMGHAEQMNQITHYLDGSNVYGSSEEEVKELRATVGGRLNSIEPETMNLLPPDEEAAECETDEDETDEDETDEDRHCFKAGDSRVNEQPDLIVIHTIWMREHNRLADRLSQANPQWNDETIYQEARKIVIAEMQHISYNEYLPIILGKEYMATNDLLPQPRGFTITYNEKVDATIFNEFATVAYRFGHTFVQGMIKMITAAKQKPTQIRLNEHFFSPKLLYTPGKLDEFLRGLTTQPIQDFDNFFSEDISNKLFSNHSQPDGLDGMDLVALNIQRGRDHGIPPYNDLREKCGLKRAKTFEELAGIIPKEFVPAFKSVYASVDDIDPFIAGVAEISDSDSLIGPLFRCIVGDQFIRLKVGDRFYYEHGDMITSFTEAQLNEIRQVSWARILCDNGDNIRTMQPLALRRPDGLNSKVSCESPAIPRVDLTPWRVGALLLSRNQELPKMG